MYSPFYDTMLPSLPSTQGWRMVRNAAKDRVETQIDLFGTGFWMPIDACPGVQVRDDFSGVIISAGAVDSLGPWSIATAGVGAVAPVAAHGGGINFSAGGVGATASIMQGSQYTRWLADEPHTCFGANLNNLVAGKQAQLGFEDAPAGNNHIKLVYDGATGNVLWSVDDGAGPTTGVLGVADTSYHIYMLRFGDDGTNGEGSKCEIAIDGVLTATLTLAATANYPATNTLLQAFSRASSTAGGAFSFDLHHINILSDLVGP